MAKTHFVQNDGTGVRTTCGLKPMDHSKVRLTGVPKKVSCWACHLVLGAQYREQLKDEPNATKAWWDNG